MKKAGLLVFVLALSVVLFAVWRLARTDPSEVALPGAPDSAPAARSDEPAQAPGLSALEPSESKAAEPGREGLPASEATGKGLETWEIARSTWVEGTIRPPSGCVDPGPIEVVASSEALDADDLATWLRDVDPPKAMLSRRRAGEDGSFRIPFPPDQKRGHLSLRGRYLYLPRSIEVDLAAPPRAIALAAECGSFVVGSVQLPADSPLATAELDGLQVVLRSSLEGPGGPMAAMEGFRRRGGVSGGAFEFQAVPADVPCVLEISPQRLAAAFHQVERLPAGRDHSVTVALLRGGTVRGIVRDPSGLPVSDAEVEAARPGRMFGFDNQTVREKKTASDGTFELPAVYPGKIVMRASKPGYLDSEPTKVDLQDGGIQTDVEIAISLGKSISGTVAWPDGKPAAAVAVEVDFDMSQMFGMGAFNMLRGREGDTKTDAQGAFTITGLGEGPFTVEAQAPPPGAESTEGDEKVKASARWKARVDGVKPGTSGLALVLREPEGLAGRVVDEKGAPVESFRIEAVRQGQGPMASFGQEQRKEDFDDDAEGRFLLTGLIEGTWKLYATADGFAVPEGIDVTIPRGAADPELVIAIVHGATVAGEVVDPAGDPVAGAKVAVQSGDPSWMSRMQAGPKPPEAASSADGTFLLESLRPGKVQLVADSKSLAKSLPLEVELAAGQRFDGARLVLRQGGTLTGEVFGEGGKPATGLFVQATQMKEFEIEMTFVDAKGEFRMENLLPGSWQVVAMPSSGGGEGRGAGDAEGAEGDLMSMLSTMKTAMVTIAEGEETHVVLGAAPKDPVDVHGRVTHGGEPYAGGMVSFVAEGKEVLKGMKMAQVGKDGTYSLKLDAPGHYSVSVQKFTGGMGQQSTVEFSRDIPEGKEYRLDLAMPTARISGQVRGPDGEPAAGARVSLHPERSLETGTFWGGQYHEGATDNDGRYDVQMLRPGTYEMGIGGMSFGGIMGEEATFGREMRGGLRLEDGEWMRDVDFRLKKPGALEVVVVEADGSPAKDAAVFVRESNGRLVDGFSMVTTKADGKARYPGLSPGTYTVAARKELLASSDSARVKIDEGGSAEVRVALQPGTILLVTCVGEESKPVRATVSVQDEDGREVGAMISLAEIMEMFGKGGFSTTEHKVGPLPQGKYKVKATGPDGKTVTKPVNLTGQAERKLTLHFD